MTKYKAVLFDLDGTLLDTTEGVVDAVKRTIEHHAFQMPDEDTLKSFVGPPMQKSMSEMFDLDEETALRLANEFRENYRKYSLLQAQLYEGILLLLEQMREQGYKLAVATNKSHQNAMDILEKFGVMEYCDYAQGSDLDGRLSKKDIIEMCINVLGCSKRETVLIGDSLFDLEGAEQAGIDFIAVTYGFGFKRGETIASENCTLAVNCVDELRQYLLNC